MDSIQKQEAVVAGLLQSAMYHDDLAKNGNGASQAWHEEQAMRKLEQAEWAERRLNWLKLGGR